MILVALVVATAAALSITGFGSPQLGAAMCRYAEALGFGGGCVPPDDAQTPTDEDLHPGVCMLSETSEKYSAEAKFFWFTLGESSGFVVQQFSDKSVRATMVDGASAGASANLGSKTLDVGKLGDGDNAGAEIKLGGNLKFEYGSTWEFENMAQFEAMKDQLDDYLVQQESLKQGSPGYALYLSLFDKWVEAPKDPKITYGKTTLEVALKANAGTRLGTGEVDSEGKEKLLNPEVGFNMSATGSTSVVVMNNHETGTRSYTVELAGEGKVGGDMILGHITGEGKVSGALTTTYDKDDQLSEITFRSALQYGASGSLGNGTFKSVSGKTSTGETDSVVTTTKLEVTDENRAMVEDWLANRSTGTQLTLPFAAMIPDRPSDDPFLQLLYEEGKTGQVEYKNIKDSWEFGMAVKKGWEFGFTVSGEEATASMTDANYLGAPGSDGVRPIIPDRKCS